MRFGFALGAVACVRSAVLVAGMALGLSAGGFSSASAEPIRGAGSTFAGPVIAAWSKSYETARADGGDFISPDWQVDYELVGSLGGIMRLGQPELDFAASDASLPPEELTKRGLRQFPFVLGAIAVIVNIDGVKPGALRLTGEVLANIYLGKIGKWSDPAIVALNPDVKLPDQRIDVLHRKDGSGSTQGFTEFLSASNAEWKTKYGADQLIAWPLGNSHSGSQALVRALAATKGAIAYVEAGQAQRAGVATVLIQNASSQFVAPDQSGVAASATTAAFSAERDFHGSLIGGSGAGAYPITVATFAIVPAKGRDAGRIRRVLDLFDLAFEKGQDQAIALGYVPLSPALIKDIRAYWVRHLGARG